MAIDLPSTWRTKISSWHWDILVWTIDIGGVILDVIDWFLGWINWSLNLGESAYNKAVDAWWKAVDVFWDLTQKIDREVDRLLGKIDTWWDELVDWWAVKRQWVKDWTRTLVRQVEDTIADLTKTLQSLDVAWEGFKRDTLPGLISWVTLEDWRKATITPIETDVAKHESWFDIIKDLMTDPEKWLLDRITSMLARFI